MESEGGPEQDMLSAGVETGMPLAEGEVFSAPEQGIASEVFAETREPPSAIDEATALAQVRQGIADEIEHQQGFDPSLQEEIEEAIEEARQDEEELSFADMQKLATQYTLRWEEGLEDEPRFEESEPSNETERTLRAFADRALEFSRDIAKARGAWPDPDEPLSTGQRPGALQAADENAGVDEQALEIALHAQKFIGIAQKLLSAQAAGGWDGSPAFLRDLLNDIGSSYGLHTALEEDLIPPTSSPSKERVRRDVTDQQIIDLTTERKRRRPETDN